MAKPEDLFDKDVRDAQEAEQAAGEAAVKPAAKDKPGEHDAAVAAARDAELKRQADVEAAVEKANEDELPKLGGPELNPGNPGHDPETGRPV